MGAEVAVLTGDLIGSSRALPAAIDQTFLVLAEAAGRLSDWHGAATRLTRFRGDGWHCVLARPDLALRSCLYLMAALRAAEAPLETRLALGFGAMTRAGSATLADADGPAFHRSGRALDAMPRGRRFTTADDGTPPALAAVVPLADWMTRRWTVAQAEAVRAMLTPPSPTQRELADSLGLTQQSVSERLDAAGFWAFSEALSVLEEESRA